MLRLVGCTFVGNFWQAAQIQPRTTSTDNHRSNKKVWQLITLWISMATLGILFYPQTASAQSPSDWQFQLEKLRVIQAQEDGIFEDGDEPYFIVIRFGARYQESGSAFVSWSGYLEEDWASGVDDNDERTIPFDMGTVSYTDMEIITRDHFSCDNIMPEGGGALIIAMEHDLTPWGVVRDIMADLQSALDVELRDLIADGNLDLDNAEEDIRLAVDRIVSSVSYDFWRSAEIVAESGGFPDDFINYHLFVFGAADSRVKDELAIPGVPQVTADVFSEQQFAPILFEGDDARYEVSSSLFATLLTPMTAVSGVNIQYTAPTVAGVPINFTATALQGTDITYHWDWGDGESSMCANASHVYEQEGTYDIIVSASNSESIEKQTISVSVSKLPPQAYLPTMFWSTSAR